MKLNSAKFAFLLRWLCCYLMARAADSTIRGTMPRLAFKCEGIDRALMQSSASHGGLPVWHRACDKIEHLDRIVTKDALILVTVGNSEYKASLHACLQSAGCREALLKVLEQANSLRIMG